MSSGNVPQDIMFLQPSSLIITMPIGEDKKSGVAGGVTAVTSTLGNGVGGLLSTVGGVTGAAARGSKCSSKHVLFEFSR